MKYSLTQRQSRARVLWCRNGFDTQSEAGRRFVECMLSIIALWAMPAAERRWR